MCGTIPTPLSHASQGCIECLEGVLPQPATPQPGCPGPPGPGPAAGAPLARLLCLYHCPCCACGCPRGPGCCCSGPGLALLRHCVAVMGPHSGVWMLPPLFPELHTRASGLRQGQLSVYPESCLPALFSGRVPHLKGPVSPLYPELPWGVAVPAPVCDLPSPSSDLPFQVRCENMGASSGRAGVFLPLPSSWAF